MRRAIGARAAEVRLSSPSVRVERVDLERILADQPRLEREDLLLDADAGSAVRLGDAVQAVVGDDLDQGVGAAALHHHGLDVADLDRDLCCAASLLMPLKSGALAVKARNWRRERRYMHERYYKFLQIKIRKLTADAHLPEYAHGPHEDAGMDLRATQGATLEPGIPQAIPTGLAIELPAGYEAQLRPRSGFALKHAITLPNAPATIDPGYRGEIKVILLNMGRRPYEYTPAIVLRKW